QPVTSLSATASALPLALLAQNALNTGDADAALELALQPIALHSGSNNRQPPPLATAYAIAIAAAETPHAEDLRKQRLSDAAEKHITPANALEPPAAIPAPAALP